MITPIKIMGKEKDHDDNKQTISRRGLIKGSIGGFAGLSAGALGAPAIINASDDTIRVGHITPRSGFLGTLGGLWVSRG